MKKYYIFFDNDGVGAHWFTWGNDTYLKEKTDYIGDLDIYKWNKIDKLMRRLSNECVVKAICISTWKGCFYDEENRDKFSERAGFQKIEIMPWVMEGRFSFREPGQRIELIKEALEDGNPDDYIILDDEFGQEFENQGFHNIIRTDTYDGFTYKNYLEMEQIVNKWDLSEEYKKAKKEYDETMDLLVHCIC